MFNLVYGLLALALAPWLCVRRWFYGKRLGSFREKFFGCLPVRNHRPSLWCHAVSVGEVIQLRPVLQELLSRNPDLDIWITTTTVTGHEVAKKLFPEHTVCFFPWDFSWSVRAALHRVRPAMVILVELELWPNFLTACERSNIPVVIINGRMSDRSFRRYRLIHGLMSRMLRQVRLILAQNETYASRFIFLGAETSVVHITGSIKFDRVASNRNNPQTAEIRASFGIDEEAQVLIAGSTQSPEELYALNVYRQLWPHFKKLRLVVVPRHQERFHEVAELIQNQGFELIRRSDSKSRGLENSSAETSPPILLLDTLGELSAAWGMADIAFVGGSLSKRGGQNMIEPAGYGAAVLFGPHTRNFQDVVDILLGNEAARVVLDEQDLLETVRMLLKDQTLICAMGSRAQDLVLHQQGATKTTVDLLLQVRSEADAGTYRWSETRRAA